MLNKPQRRRRPGAGAGAGAAAGLCLVFVLLTPSQGMAYQGEVHQKLTFHAAKWFNRCLTETMVPPLSPLQVRYAAKSNVALADSNVLVRMFRWNYYDRGGQQERSALWLVSTRLHQHFNKITRRLEQASEPAERYQELGRIVYYLQLMTSPSKVVPVYTGRFWRGSFSDRFDRYRLDDDALDAALADSCDFLDDPPVDFSSLLVESASATLDAVRSPIGGLPTTWQAFWKISSDPDSFGEYGPAGNSFGRKTDFPCGDARSKQRRCVLLKRDPIYAEFALERHVAAARSTARAMLLLQQQYFDSAQRSEKGPEKRPEQQPEPEPGLDPMVDPNSDLTARETGDAE
jgi:hypothetical protein